MDKNNAHQVHKYDVKKSNLSFFIPNVLSKDVSKQTKDTKKIFFMAKQA